MGRWARLGLMSEVVVGKGANGRSGKVDGPVGLGCGVRNEWKSFVSVSCKCRLAKLLTCSHREALSGGDCPVHVAGICKVVTADAA